MAGARGTSGRFRGPPRDGVLFAGGSRLRDDTGDDARSGDARGDAVGDGARTDGDGERAAGERARGGGDGRAGLLARRWVERYGGAAASTVLALLRDEAHELRAVEAVPDERAVDASDSGSDRSVAVAERVWRRCCWP